MEWLFKSNLFKSHILCLKYTRAYKVKDVALMIQQHWLCSVWDKSVGYNFFTQR